MLRAAEIDADVILLAKNVDGVYTADPVKDPTAVKYDVITYDDVLAQHLAVMDSTATSLSMDNHIPVLLFALKDPRNIIRALCGENVGTIVRNESTHARQRLPHSTVKGKDLFMLKEDYKIYEGQDEEEHRLRGRGLCLRAGGPGQCLRAGPDHGGLLRQPHPHPADCGHLFPRRPDTADFPWDKTAVKSIEKAIQNSDLGINPQNDGASIRLSFPS